LAKADALTGESEQRHGIYFPFAALTFAQRNFAAAEILALPAALILRLFFGAATATGLVEEPKIRPSSFSSD